MMFIPVSEAVDTTCLMEGNDSLRRKRMRYMALAKEVYSDINLSTVKMTKRFVLCVNKQLNCVDLPREIICISGVSVYGENGEHIPVYRNDSVPTDFVDFALAKDCACECGGSLCNIVKAYETLHEQVVMKMPDDTDKTFNCYSRKKMDGDMLVEEKSYPAAVYDESGTWTDTVLQVVTREVCKLDVDEKGCVQEVEHNRVMLDGCGCGSGVIHCPTKLTSFGIESGVSFSRSAIDNRYSLSQAGDRLYFPSEFGYGKVIVRAYVVVSLKDMVIPYKAKLAFMVGLRVFDMMLNDKINPNLKVQMEARYGKLKFALTCAMNEFTMEEIMEIATPQTKMF